MDIIVNGNTMDLSYKVFNNYDPVRGVISDIFKEAQHENHPAVKPIGRRKHCRGFWNALSRCATDRLIFGQGTQVTVEPRIQPPTKPSVFIMRNGTNVACLVKDFYPKNVHIYLNASKKIAEFDPAIAISPSGRYSAVKLGRYEDSNSVTCSVQHNNEIVPSTDFESKTRSFGTVKPEPEQTSDICHGPKVHTEKVNMMSLTVLGLRMLFAKSVAINFLLTAKVFFF